MIVDERVWLNVPEKNHIHLCTQCVLIYQTTLMVKDDLEMLWLLVFVFTGSDWEACIVVVCHLAI